jgi:hypothetical protein
MIYLQFRVLEKAEFEKRLARATIAGVDRAALIV